MKASLARRPDNDKGFTLIELMVVVLIIAILLAIAIPTFLGAQNKAKDRSAQSSARNALTNAKAVLADTGLYAAASTTTTGLATTAMQVALKASEPALTFVEAPTSSVGPKFVSVLVSAGGQQIYAAVLSQTNTCYYLRDSLVATEKGTMYSKTANLADTTCIAVATPATAYSDTGW